MFLIVPTSLFLGKVFANEVNSHREQIIELDKTGTHLKYFSQKQDVVLIKNLLISVQSRWEKVVQRLVERGRSLDDARKRAKQVNLYKDPLNLAMNQVYVMFLNTRYVIKVLLWQAVLCVTIMA